MIKIIDSEDLDPCNENCKLDPVGLFMCTTPGYICDKHNVWASMTRKDFKIKFGISFNQYLKTNSVAKYKTGNIKVTNMGNAISMSSSRKGKASGSSRCRRLLRRKERNSNASN